MTDDCIGYRERTTEDTDRADYERARQSALNLDLRTRIAYKRRYVAGHPEHGIIDSDEDQLRLAQRIEIRCPGQFVLISTLEKIFVDRIIDNIPSPEVER
ncbi:hypothetical protein J4462_02725 [Candidatus Pacearchaeota archaeon]|nr:hypothetical protein [Candidatus Pacearchaeota archaeon]